MEQIGLVLLLLILPVLFFLIYRVRAGKAGDLRPLPGFEALPGLLGRAAETGKPLHVSVGVGGIGGSATAETWAGLTVLRNLADAAAACDTPLLITVSDATVVPLAQDVLWRAHVRNGTPEAYDPTHVQFISPEPMAYAAGVAGLLERESLTANVMIGSFGEEYLLMGETGARRGVHQIVGTSDPQTLPLVYATADDTLVGEEAFAGGAYTSRLPVQIASLLAEDWARWALAAGILVAAAIKLLL